MGFALSTVQYKCKCQHFQTKVEFCVQPYGNYNSYLGQQVGSQQQSFFDEKKVRNYYEKQVEKQMKQEFNKMYKNFMSGLF